MKTFFKELFEYNHHYNLQLWEALNAHQDRVSEKAVRLYNHILNAHQIWNNRIDPRQAPYGVWEIHPLHTLKDIAITNHEESLLILNKYDLDDNIKYQKSTGKEFHNRVRDVIFHIVNHTTYHRGQIAAEFRAGGLDPLATDYIVYKR